MSHKAEAKKPALLRLCQIIPDRIPVSPSNWYSGVKSGRYPPGIQLGPRTTAYREDQIDRLVRTGDWRTKEERAAQEEG
ncbi:MAG: transcriptional regulator [Gammaproteobacteria bacterium]|jgi:predicted DNA-binding transcriptional regulator AlpA|nr:transcriptional regulator [Gammaproteobacteria bacterium]